MGFTFPIDKAKVYYEEPIVANFVSILKQSSTWNIWHKNPELLKKHYWKEHTLWSDGYFAASIGQVSQEIIEHYIENQG